MLQSKSQRNKDYIRKKILRNLDVYEFHSLNAKQKQYLYYMEDAIIQLHSSYGGNLDIIIDDVLYDAKPEIIDLYILKTGRYRTAYKNAVKINDVIYELGNEELYKFTISQSDLTDFTHEEDPFHGFHELESKIKKYMEMIEEYLKYHERITEDLNKAILNENDLSFPDDILIKGETITMSLRVKKDYSFELCNVKEKSPKVKERCQ